ncbi:MAG: TetR/AcrR family transcriptional regulator [Candidatus Methylacidiphilales bacterium]
MKSKRRTPEQTRHLLLDNALACFQRQGYCATTVDQICAEARITKGSFFYHFPTKEELGVEVIRWWSQRVAETYSKAWQDSGADPLQQLDELFSVMTRSTEYPGQPCICAWGMMAQEMALTHEKIRQLCEQEFKVWTQHVLRLLEAARKHYPPSRRFDPERVAWFLNSLWQGSMLVGKTCQSPELIRSNLQLARHYVMSHFSDA